MKIFIIQHEKFFDDASWLLTQFEVPLKSILLALKLAKKHNLKTIMDPAPVKKMSNNNIQIEQDKKASQQNFNKFYSYENNNKVMNQNHLNLMYGG